MVYEAQPPEPSGSPKQSRLGDIALGNVPGSSVAIKQLLLVRLLAPPIRSKTKKETPSIKTGPVSEAMGLKVYVDDKMVELFSPAPKCAVLETLNHVAEKLQREGLIEILGHSGTARLTEVGRTQACVFLETEVPKNVTWDEIFNGYLIAKALGVAEILSRDQVKKLMKLEGIRNEVIRLHYRLNLRPVPKYDATFKRHLRWAFVKQQVIVSQQLVREVEKQEKALSDDIILNCFVSQALGQDKYERGTELLTKFAACILDIPLIDVYKKVKHGQSQKIDPLKFRLYLLRRLFGRSDSAPTSTAGKTMDVSTYSQRHEAKKFQHEDAFQSQKIESSTPTETEVDASLQMSTTPEFAQRVLDAAARSSSGRVGQKRVFVNHVYDMLGEEGLQVSLEAFKAQLLELDHADLVRLGGPEMPVLLNKKDREASRIQDGKEILVFVKLP